MKNAHGLRFESSIEEMFEFYKGKRVLITGHTGFKGSWLSLILKKLGAEVYGYALSPISPSNLYEILDLKEIINSKIGDIRNLDDLSNYFDFVNPDVVFHLAAQPLVSESYINPIETYSTNIMGTINMLECLRKRKTENVVSFVNVTTDKVYENKEWHWGYREIDTLNGYDPYSNSKSCVELVSDSYYKSFFNKTNTSIVNVRAGNVIGGGDFSINRIVPDTISSILNNSDLNLRNPNSIRPYQHVFEPLFAYIWLGYVFYLNKGIKEEYNIGPEMKDCVTSLFLSEQLIKEFQSNININFIQKNIFHETGYLRLDNSKIKADLGWKPILNIIDAIELTANWTKEFYFRPKMIIDKSYEQINHYIEKLIKSYV